MTRGPQPTTRRGRAAGARELRAWLSADEYARWQAAAKAAGLTLGDYVRSLTPEEERAAGRWAPTNTAAADPPSAATTR